MTTEATAQAGELDLVAERVRVQALRRSLGARLALYRQAAGVSQPQLGQALGRTRSLISKIEHGQRGMPARLWTIADELCGAQGALVAEHSELVKAEEAYRARSRAHHRQAQQKTAQAKAQAALKAWPASSPAARPPDLDVAWPQMTGVDGELARELLAVVMKLVQTVGRRNAISMVGSVLAAVGLSGLDPDEHTRLAQAVASPSRVDAPVVGNLAATLAQCKRLEDTLGPCEVLDTVIAQHQLVRRLLDGDCSERLRRALKVVDSTMASAIGSYLIDMNQPETAKRYFAHARKAGHDAGNPACAAYAAAHISFAAFLCGDTPTALDTAAAARSLAARTDDLRLKASAEQTAAAAYALEGQYGLCMAASERAHDLLTNTHGPTPESLAYWVCHGTLDSQRSIFLGLLNKPHQAVEAAINARAAYQSSLRPVGYTHTEVRLAHALVLAKDITEAARILGEAASGANLYPRLIRELHATRALMQPWAATPAITTLDAQLETYGLMPTRGPGRV